MRRIIYIFISLAAVLWVGCKEEGRIDHIDDSAPAPAQVSDVTVHNTPGGAILKYKAPMDKNLRYIRAEYEIQPGVLRETKSSYYMDSLVLEGFGDTRTYDVKLYSVGKNEKASEPLTVQVNPTTAPVHLASKQLREAFGGVSVRIENPEKANLAIVLMGDTAQTGYQSILQTFFTSSETANFAFRGLDTVPGNYSAYLRDRWNNLSDTIAATLTPWYEEYIPKNTWTELHLPTDTYEPYRNDQVYAVSKAWDDNTTAATGGCFISPEEAPIPQWQTWDLGVTIVLSRLKLWHCWNYVFQYCNQKKFELWGSINPNPDGSWDESWIPLGAFECLKPSGLGDNITVEDIAFARDGFDFELENNDFAPNPFVPIRYIRFKTVTVWEGPVKNGAVYLQEISFWGQIQE